MLANEMIKSINKLELSQKLLLVEDIWDAIAKENSELPLYQWQKSELDRRYREFKEGKVKLFEFKSLHQSIREKYR